MNQNRIHHKGIYGTVEISFEYNVLYGRLEVSDLVKYEAETPAKLYEEFCAAVDDYLAYKKKKEKWQSIMTKKKQPKKCKQCHKPFYPSKPMQTVCDFHCAAQKAREDRLKKQDKKEADRKRLARKKSLELKRGDLNWQHDRTQIAFNKMRKLEEFLWFKERGMEPECISCGKTNMDWCCGHFKTRGSQKELAYDRSNTFLQCNFYCNRNLAGNINGNKTTRGYIQGLKDRFGNERASKIITYCEVKRVKKWTCDELEGMRKEFNKPQRS